MFHLHAFNCSETAKYNQILSVIWSFVLKINLIGLIKQKGHFSAAKESVHSSDND